MKTRAWLTIVAVLAFSGWCVSSAAAQARMTLKTICHVKGQEENTLQGIGIVTGLKGTGDGGSSPALQRAMAQAMQNLGMPLGKAGPAELKDSTKNVALVLVTAKIPGAGAREGEDLDCFVSSIGSAKSLVGGYLFTTSLVSQDPRNPQVYANAAGKLSMEGIAHPLTARVPNGCHMIQDVMNPFLKDGKITLVLNESFADFQVAAEVVNVINTSPAHLESYGAALAKAIDQNSIEVKVPPQYLAEDPVGFLSYIMNLTISDPQVGPRIVVNEREGCIVMGGDVEIAPVVVTHKNIVVEAGGTGGARFVALDPTNQAPTVKSLVEALTALHVPAEDTVQILKQLEKSGKLRARLIIE